MKLRDNLGIKRVYDALGTVSKSGNKEKSFLKRNYCRIIQTGGFLYGNKNHA